MSPSSTAGRLPSGVAMKVFLRLALVVGVVALLYQGSGSVLSDLRLADWSSWALGGGILLYALALSIPFVPGVELGVALMLVFGRPGVALVYFGTLLGLSLAFLAGRRVPLSFLISVLDWLQLTEARDRIRKWMEASPNRAMERMRRVSPKRLAERFARHRYLLLALAINVPGNVVVGGGGGIALLAGLSGQFRYWLFLAVCAVAVAPIPLLFFLATFAR